MVVRIHLLQQNTPLVELVDTLVLGTSPKGLRVRVSYGVLNGYNYVKKNLFYEVQKIVWQR
jgi:hypothetical protein